MNTDKGRRRIRVPEAPSSVLTLRGGFYQGVRLARQHMECVRFSPDISQMKLVLAGQPLRRGAEALF
jgi:hypothetical protein